MSIFLPVVAVLVGFLIAYFIKAGSNAVQLLLSFSGALLLSITVFEFLPEVYHIHSKNTGIMIMAGILLQLFLEFLSKGAEHGHLHHHENQKSFPILLFISLCIHAFIEGYPIGNNFHLMLGVVVHKIPIAIIISSFLFNSKMNRANSLLFLLLFAAMTPLGSLAHHYFTFSNEVENSINALVIGIFLHVSTTILFESSKNHQFNTSKIIAIVLGVATAYFL